MPVSKQIQRRHKTNAFTGSASSSMGESSTSLLSGASHAEEDDPVQQPLDCRDANERYPVGTVVKKVRFCVMFGLLLL